MLTIIPRPAAVRALALLAALSTPGACTTWRPTDLRGAQAPPRPGERAVVVCVTRRSGAAVRLWAPRVTGDSLVGRTGAKRGSPTVAVALADVAAIERREEDVGQSVAAVGGGLLAALYLWVYLGLRSW